MAVFGSLLSLLTSISIDNAFGTRHDSNRELLGHGVGNMASGIFGGVPGCGAVPRTLASHRAGGRTSLAGMVCGLIHIIIAVMLGSLVGKLPVVVFAAIAFWTGVNVLDKWTLNLIKKLTLTFRQEGLSFFKREGDVLVDLAMVLVVTGLIIGGNLIFAVGLGVLPASVLFIIKMGKSNIRRKYCADTIRCRRVRPERQLEILRNEGTRIIVFELEGSLFFGSAEKLAKEIELSLGEASYCILDMKHVGYVDSTGANIILQACKSVVRNRQNMLICHLGKSLHLKQFLNTLDATGIIDERNYFPDIDAALEWAEQDLLAKSSTPSEGGEEDALLYRFAFKDYLSLHQEKPEIVIKLLSNIGKILSRNLRLSNEKRMLLEES
ncbi:MAG: SulP family inorganic anion transporter [Syntrophobacteraceae bacterium]